MLVVDRRRTLRKTSRVLTYVPEISDRKFRYQTFLQNSLSSPPHLRRRTREQQASTPPAPRHATPDRMETRNKTAKLDKVTPTQFDTCYLSWLIFFHMSVPYNLHHIYCLTGRAARVICLIVLSLRLNLTALLSCLKRNLLILQWSRAVKHQMVHQNTMLVRELR